MKQKADVAQFNMITLALGDSSTTERHVSIDATEKFTHIIELGYFKMIYCQLLTNQKY